MSLINTIFHEIVHQVSRKRQFLGPIYNVVKRIFDIVLSLLGMVILSPVFLIIAIIIKIDSKGPVFFVHNRIGEKGKEY